MPLFTICIPMCRTEKYLEQCIKSIQSQTLTDFECIIVNDGSTGCKLDEFNTYQDEGFKHTVDLEDIAPEKQGKHIFDTLVGKDSRFKWYDKPNGGVSDVRNFALDKYTGEWLLIVDADDWVLPNHLENFANGLKNYKGNKFPVVYFHDRQFYNSETKSYFFHSKNVNLVNLMYDPSLCQWNYIAKIDLIRKYKIHSEERLGPGPFREDKIIKFGFDDLDYAWKYVEAVEKEYGGKGYEFVDTGLRTYMYRDIPNSGSKPTDPNLNIWFEYGKYLRGMAQKNSNLGVKLAGAIYPYWTTLWKSTNPVKQIIRKSITFSIRLLSGSYF